MNALRRRKVDRHTVSRAKCFVSTRMKDLIAIHGGATKLLPDVEKLPNVEKGSLVRAAAVPNAPKTSSVLAFFNFPNSVSGTSASSSSSSSGVACGGVSASSSSSSPSSSASSSAAGTKSTAPPADTGRAGRPPYTDPTDYFYSSIYIIVG